MQVMGNRCKNLFRCTESYSPPGAIAFKRTSFTLHVSFLVTEIGFALFFGSLFPFHMVILQNLASFFKIPPLLPMVSISELDLFL